MTGGVIETGIGIETERIDTETIETGIGSSLRIESDREIGTVTALDRKTGRWMPEHQSQSCRLLKIAANRATLAQRVGMIQVGAVYIEPEQTLQLTLRSITPDRNESDEATRSPHDQSSVW
jgi:hypothetical protein